MKDWKEYNDAQEHLKKLYSKAGLPYEGNGKYEEEKRKRMTEQVIKWASVIIWSLLLGIVLVGIASAAEPALVVVARAQIGNGETWGDNRGAYVRKYLNGKENLPWCAGFVSYCFRRAGYNMPYTLRAKDYLKYGKQVKKPIPGDLIVLSRSGGGHVGIIEQVKGDTITTIEGNTGKYPSKVKRIVYKGKPKNLIAYIRINRMKEARRG